MLTGLSFVLYPDVGNDSGFNVNAYEAATLHEERFRILKIRVAPNPSHKPKTQ